jgi:AcrR family transcriptional regulator
MTTKSLETQKKILNAARQIFLKKGFSGTSMSQIAKEANVAKALLFHYFKTKEDLWKNVKDEVIGQNIIESLNCVPTDSFEHFIEFIIDARFTLYGENQDLVHMMNWQRLEVQEEIAGTTSLPADMWKKELEQFQSTGEINQEMDTTLLQNLIFSLSSLPFLEKWEWTKNKEKLEEYKFLLKRTINFIAKNPSK